MTAYDRGVGLERSVAKLLEGVGWYVVRSAGSHGPVDLVCLHRRWAPWLVQCKVDRHDIGPTEWHDLYGLAVDLGSTAILADRSGPRRTPRLWAVQYDRGHRGSVDDALLHIEWKHLRGGT